MVNINGNDISINKKNSAVIDINLFNPDGSNFNPSPDDVVTFSIKRMMSSEMYMMKKEVTPNYLGLCSFSFNADELDIPVGKYLYDVKIYHTDGREETVINPSLFEIVEVVNND